MNTFKRAILFNEDRKKKLRALRDRLDFLPNGTQSKIAKNIGCTRQTVHNVLFSYDDELAARSDFAYQVWKELERIVSEPDNVREYDMMKSIVDGLRKGSNIKLEMALPQFRLIKRKLDKMGIPYTLNKSRGWPNIYTLTPKQLSKAA